MIQHLEIDMVLTICSLLLRNSFIDFTNFFRVWVPFQSQEQISIFLHNLDWTNMHVHDLPYVQQGRQNFVSFIEMCKHRTIHHALCYDASKNLLERNRPEENLHVLQVIADHHSPSFVAFHVFNSIYRVEIAEMSATSLMMRLGSLHFRAELRGCVEMLMNRSNAFQRVGWEPRPRLTPKFPLCSFASTRSPFHFFIHSWPPTIDKVLSCTCSKCLLQMLWYIIFEEY